MLLPVLSSLPTQVAPPEVDLDAGPPAQVAGVGVVALPVLPGDDGPLLGPGTAELLDQVDLDLGAVLEQAGASGATGEVTAVPLSGPQLARLTNPDLRLVLLVGVGAASPSDLRRAGAALARRTRDLDAVATSVPAVAGGAGLRAFVEGLVLASFDFSMRSAGPRRQPVRRVVLAGCGAEPATLERALTFARAAWLSRTLATVPSNVKNPAWFVEQAVAAADAAGLTSTVLDEQQLAAQGFGGLVSVGQASATPPRLLRLEYRPPRVRGSRHVVLVGKGITFDSGGLSIKPGESMVTMKRDMTGAAVVLATMLGLAEIGCTLRVTALLALAENAVGGSAMRPGDVITHYGGRTTEVTNTDAEGRLVLADGMAYAVSELEPDVIVDVATLTGAVKVALGLGLGGLFSNDDALAGLLDAAGSASGEPLWRLPLAEVYEERLSSDVADADNAPGHAQAITAALFLQHFAGGRPWAHLDIASVGDAAADDGEWTTGPTGFGSRLLLTWLEGADPLAGV